MVKRYVGYEELREALERTITPETVFVCVGSSKVTFDIFGPLMGELLNKAKDVLDENFSFLLISAYTTGVSPTSLKNILS